MGFLDSYKALEKLCSDMYGERHGLSLYIEEMKNTYTGARYVVGWDEDLKKLKHYRWVRNKIIHEPGYSEENMCEPEDSVWLDDFYSRVLSRTDPLAMYRKALTERRQNTYDATRIQPAPSYSYQDRKTGSGNSDLWARILVFLGLLFLLLCFLNYVYR